MRKTVPALFAVILIAGCVFLIRSRNSAKRGSAKKDTIITIYRYANMSIANGDSSVDHFIYQNDITTQDYDNCNDSIIEDAESEDTDSIMTISYFEKWLKKYYGYQSSEYDY